MQRISSKSKLTLKEDKIEINVPHVEQKHRWDCGLACTQMVLAWLDYQTDNFKSLCKQLGFGESVWTIDIANILNRYDVKHRFYTITLGADEGYSNKNFYRNSFKTDEQRVNELFSNASNIGISLDKKSVDLEDILTHLSKGNLAVVLTDWSKLNCRWCNKKCMSPSFGCMSSCISMYQGHFIVVCGYSLKDKLIYYHNPSFKEDLCCCSMRTFEQARKSYGTDEDLLLVFKPE